MSESPPQLSATILNKLEIFANTAWHIPSAFQCKHHRDDTSRDVEYFHLQDHSVALQYLFGNAIGRRNKILVRSEYREALQALQTDVTYERGAYIIGQPGIGKTMFLIYALIERLREHKPVAVQLHANDPFYAFFTHTCSLYALTDPSPLMQEGVWVLSDLHASTNTPLDIFRRVSAMVIQTTLPSIKYWERCNQHCDARAFVMNVWSEDEIADLSSLMELDVERMTTLAVKWGGVPRTLLQQYTNDELQQDWEIRSAAMRAAENYATLHALDTQNIGTTSTIFFVLPFKDRADTVWRRRYDVRVPTPTLRNALAMALQQLQSKARIDFFLTMFVHPATHTCARNMYANWFHSLITSGREIYHMWGGGHSWLREALNSMQGKQPPIIRDATKLTNPPYYWISPSGEFPGIDCALVTESTILAIQLTTHFRPLTPQIGVDKLRKLWNRKSQLSWKLVFVGVSEELVHGARKQWEYEPLSKVVTVGYSIADPAALGILDLVEDTLCIEEIRDSSSIA